MLLSLDDVSLASEEEWKKARKGVANIHFRTR